MINRIRHLLGMHIHDWEYAWYPDVYGWQRFRHCLTCDQVRVLDFDGWCEFTHSMAMKHGLSTNEALALWHAKAVPDADPRLALLPYAEATSMGKQSHFVSPLPEILR